MVRHYLSKINENADIIEDNELGSSIIIKLENIDGSFTSSEIEVPLTTTKEQLFSLLTTLIEEEDSNLFSLFKGKIFIENNILDTLKKCISEGYLISTEDTLIISYQKSSKVSVKPVCRFVSALKGHSSPVLCLKFFPNSKFLVTGSGDCTVRIWDSLTYTPRATLKYHTKPVVVVAISPCNHYIASGSLDRSILIWKMSDILSSQDPKPIYVFNNNKDTVTCLEFMLAIHSQVFINQTPILSSGFKNGEIKLWDIFNGRLLFLLSGHTAMVTDLRWSKFSSQIIDSVDHKGPFLYSSSRDMTIKLWSYNKKAMLNSVRVHGHWINQISLNHESITRAGAYYIEESIDTNDINKIYEKARFNYNKYCGDAANELLLTSSDDNTLALIDPFNNFKIIKKLIGHKKGVCCGIFSPNTNFIISGSFDNSIKIWNGKTGEYINTFNDNVGPVFKLSWSADSRMFCSCSRDTSIKIYNILSKKLVHNLPGASDELYCIEWSNNGNVVASAGKDGIVRFWSH